MFKDIYITGLRVKPGVYKATDPAVREKASKYAPLNKPWYFVEVNADGVGRLFKDVSSGISASISQADSLADAGAKVVDVKSFTGLEPAKGGEAEEKAPVSAPSISEALRAKLSTAAPRSVEVEAEGEGVLESDYAEMEFSDLRKLAKGRGLSASGGRDAIIARLVKADLGDEEE